MIFSAEQSVIINSEYCATILEDSSSRSIDFTLPTFYCGKWHSVADSYSFQIYGTKLTLTSIPILWILAMHQFTQLFFNSVNDPETGQGRNQTWAHVYRIREDTAASAPTRRNNSQFVVCASYLRLIPTGMSTKMCVFLWRLFLSDVHWAALNTTKSPSKNAPEEQWRTTAAEQGCNVFG